MMRSMIINQQILLFCGLVFLPVLNIQGQDLTLINARIYTVNTKQPWAEALIIKDGVIDFVGTNKKAIEYSRDDENVVDLDGKLVLPGFHDIHMHPLEAYAPPESICILEGGQSVKKHLDRIKSCREEQRDSEWFIGWGHYIDDIIHSAVPPRELLDKLFADKPAVIFELTSHSNWVNTAALARIGWDKNTPNPPGGVIVKDKITAEPNGIVFDVAGDMINEIIYAPNDELLSQTYAGLLKAMQELSAFGITSVADARVYWTRKHHEVWMKAEREGTLKTRTVLALWAYPQLSDAQIEHLKSLYLNQPTSLLRITEVKTYVDGLIGNTTAALKKPYEMDFHITPENQGLNYFSQERLTKFISELEKTGFNFNIHAIGDRGVHEALNAIESAARINAENSEIKDKRHRITHVELIDDLDLPRFKELGITADFQFAGEWTHPAEYNSYTRYFIKGRIKNANRVRSVYDSRARVTLSSDFDVSSMNPLVGIQNALTRGDQSLPNLGAAIKAYTLNGAYALAHDDRTGSIETGKVADLIVLDKNIFDIPASKISSTKVILTLLGGKQMYRDKNWR